MSYVDESAYNYANRNLFVQRNDKSTLGVVSRDARLTFISDRREFSGTDVQSNVLSDTNDEWGIDPTKNRDNEWTLWRSTLFNLFSHLSSHKQITRGNFFHAARIDVCVNTRKWFGFRKLIRYERRCINVFAPISFSIFPSELPINSQITSSLARSVEREGRKLLTRKIVPREKEREAERDSLHIGLQFLWETSSFQGRKVEKEKKTKENICWKYHARTKLSWKDRGKTL